MRHEANKPETVKPPRQPDPGRMRRRQINASNRALEDAAKALDKLYPEAAIIVRRLMRNPQ